MPSILQKMFTSSDMAARLADIQAQAQAAAEAEAKARARYEAVRDLAAVGEVDLSELAKAKEALRAAEAHSALLADTCGAIDARHAATLAAEERARLEAKWKRIVELSDARTAAAEAFERKARELAECKAKFVAAADELTAALPFNPQTYQDAGLLLTPQFNSAVDCELRRSGITSESRKNPHTGEEFPPISKAYRAAGDWIRRKRDEALGKGE